MELFRLDQGEGFKEFVHGADAARHDDEGVAVFDQERFPREKITHVHTGIQPGIDMLLMRQNDVDSNTATAGFLRPAIGRFHDAGSAAGHHREAQTGDFSGNLPCFLIPRMAFIQPGGAEYRDARAHKMEGAQAAEEVEENEPQGFDFLPSAVRPCDELSVRRSKHVTFAGGFCHGDGGRGSSRGSRGRIGRHARNSVAKRGRIATNDLVENLSVTTWPAPLIARARRRHSTTSGAHRLTLPD